MPLSPSFSFKGASFVPSLPEESTVNQIQGAKGSHQMEAMADQFSGSRACPLHQCSETLQHCLSHNSWCLIGAIRKKLPNQESPSSTRIFRLTCYSPGPRWPAWLHLPTGKDAFPALLWLAQLLLGAASPWPAFDSPSGNRMSNATFVGLQQNLIWA